MRAKLSLFIRVLIGIGLVVAIFASVDLGEVVSTLATTDPRWFLVLCAIAILLRALKSYKWWLLLSARDVPVSAWQTLRLSFESNVAGIFTPAAVGSDVYRVAVLSNLRKHNEVISTLVVERAIGFTLLVIAVAVTLPFAANFIDEAAYDALLIAISVLFALGCALVVLLQLRHVREYANKVLLPAFPFLAKIKSIVTACLEFRHHQSLLKYFALLTVTEIVALVMISFAAARSLQIDLPLGYWLTMVPLLQLLLRLPVSLHGIGLQEGLYVYVLILAGFSAEDGLSIAIVIRIVGIFLILLPGVLLLSMRSRMTEPVDDSIQGDNNSR